MSTVKDILEIIYFLSGPLIVIIGIKGLRQITVTKENAVLSAERESLKMAAEQCKNYFENIIPLQDKLDEAIKDQNIDFFEKSKVEVHGNSFKVKPYNDGLDGLMNVAPQTVAVLNALESFSTFFMSRVASEKIAFSAVGVTFCNEVKYLLPILGMAAKEQYFRNVVGLFLLWNARLEKQELMQDKKQIEKRLNSIADKEITPLGTE